MGRRTVAQGEQREPWVMADHTPFSPDRGGGNGRGADSAAPTGAHKTRTCFPFQGSLRSPWATFRRPYRGSYNIRTLTPRASNASPGSWRITRYLGGGGNGRGAVSAAPTGAYETRTCFPRARFTRPGLHSVAPNGAHII